jgi:hypothetical protein
MKPYYYIEYFNKLFNMWIRHNHIKYKTLEAAQTKTRQYKSHKLGIKLRICKLEIVSLY